MTAAAAPPRRLQCSAWCAVAAVLATGSLLAWYAPTAALDWQPARAAAEPWRCVSAAFVHWSARHLAANLAGTVVVAALGAAAGLGRRAALAWLVAWPATHAALALQPALAHYGGLSGVLHSGVAIAGLDLVRRARGARRMVGGAILAGLALKLGVEAPWGAPLVRPPDWDIAIAPFAHFTGAVAGLVCAWLLLPAR